MKAINLTIYGGFPTCEDDTCTLNRHCTNHVSAGDFRSEYGVRPHLEALTVGDDYTATAECHTYNITTPIDNFDVDDPEKVSYGEAVYIDEISTQRNLF